MKTMKMLLFPIVNLILFISVPAAIFAFDSEDVKPSKMLSLFEKANFSISAKIYYGDEDEEEVPVKTEFYLLDKSVIEILKTANFTTENQGEIPDEEVYLEALAKLLTEQKDEEDDILNYLFWESVHKNTVAEFETDYFGYGKSAPVKSGNYYLFACEQMGDEIFVWNYPVYLSGTKLIQIDQSNAAAVLSDR